MINIPKKTIAGLLLLVPSLLFADANLTLVTVKSFEKTIYQAAEDQSINNGSPVDKQSFLLESSGKKIGYFLAGQGFNQRDDAVCFVAWSTQSPHIANVIPTIGYGNWEAEICNGTGKVNFNDLHVNALIDKSTTAILKHCASGKHLSKVELSVCKAGGQQVEYARITLEDVLVTSLQYTGADNGDTVGVTYAFQASKVKQQYWEQTSAGGKGAESSAGWNIKENKEA